ncbi:MAG: TetR/AcrR family transcriptional regulator [Gordonia sp. (in: high G+C Gram-positive bacteria)]|uniref:TetR/AcrR family transcriptional regulator n=1 Tax=Gordonia sp. (in: high G+C Gram-positive bacteria) TaxID=84139 RepID=UPI0039E2A168
MAYHHGDLAKALVEAGLDVTRSGGPAALTVRDVARRVGVSANATYRHYPDRAALLHAVSGAIQQRMADVMADIPQTSPTERLRAVGLGYIAFALTEPGWFTTCFFGEHSPGPDELAQIPPYRALSTALDAMVDAGLVAPDDRDGATWSCWSMVHGFAELALRGPLSRLTGEQQWPYAEKAVDAAIAGIVRR